MALECAQDQDTFKLKAVGDVHDTDSLCEDLILL